MAGAPVKASQQTPFFMPAFPTHLFESIIALFRNKTGKERKDAI